jgi:nucleotide-binding universal stress UspA family protein
LVERIAVGANGHPEGRDAAILGARLADAIGTELVLVAVHPDTGVIVPPEPGWKEMKRNARALLQEIRDAVAPAAGSRRRGTAARLLMGTTGELLMHDGRCAILVAPRPGSAS